MTTGRDNAIRTGAIALTAGLALIAVAAGFVLLPQLEGHARLQGVWDAICSAAGIVRQERPEPALPATRQGTQVVLTQPIMRPASAESIGRGATLALRCTMCHGARGLSEANSPNLAGQYAAVIYKQLSDYKSGARTSAIMAPIVAGLTDENLRDLAAYYAYLPSETPEHPERLAQAPPIVATGAPMRNIAPCGSCHGGPDTKPGGAWLEGQPLAYLRTQLLAFAADERHNDINAVMRNVARRMTPDEIEQAARFYANQQ
jgi:cytochrome c553